MLVHIIDSACVTVPDLCLRDNNLLSKPLCQNIFIAAAQEANVHGRAICAEQKISGAVNCTHFASPLPNGLLLPISRTLGTTSA
jgi:hypothetical protein